MAGPGAPEKGDRPDLLTAAIFAGFGALGLWQTRHLAGGTLAQMGPGYLPRVVCILLILLAAVIAWSALRRTAVAIDPIKLRPVVVITLSIVAFAFAATHLGFVIASLLLVIAGSLADPGSRLRTTLILAAGLTAFGAIVFVYALGVQVPLWPF